MAALSTQRSALRSPPLGPRSAVLLPPRKRVVPRQPLGAGLRVSVVSEPAVAPPVVSNVTHLEPASHHPGSAASAASTPIAAPVPQQQAPPPYLWLRHWIPVAPLASLDPSRPTAAMLLGQPLVVWHHASRGWVVMRDVCPHRLAPLSEGRLEAGGTRLACAYHGWEFSEEGKCTRVPQLASNPRAAATACGSKRSCVTSFPTLELDGLLFAWLDDSEEGRLAAESAEKPKLLDERAPSPFGWLMNEMPADYTFWLEQSMDPTHANFLHEGVSGFNSSNALPLDGKIADGVDPLSGFIWEHGGYEKKNVGMKATRDFVPPFLNRVSYIQPSGSLAMFWIMSVPVRPGVARVYFKVGFGKAAPTEQQQQQQPGTPSSPPSPQHQAANGEAPAAPASASSSAPAPASSASESTGNGNSPATAASGPQQDAVGSARKPSKQGAGGRGLAGLFGPMPHWMVGSQLIGDQDVIMMCRQEALMRRSDLTARSYNLNSKADGGVAGVNVWLRKVGYPGSLWGEKPAVQTGLTYSNWPAQELSLEQILSRQERHVRHCAVCQQGLKQVTAVCTALTVAAGLAAMVAATLAVMAAISPAGATTAVNWWALAGAVVAAVGFAAAAIKGWTFREERFISGAAQWRRLGGFARKGAGAK